MYANVNKQEHKIIENLQIFKNLIFRRWQQL